MGDDFNFVETDSTTIYNQIITTLENGVGEPLYPGDERRIFGEALVPIFVAVFSKINDAAKQKMLKYARGAVLDALGERVSTPRIQPQPAKTTIRFNILTIQSTNIIIPKGTKITPDENVYFITDNAAILQSGNLFVDVAASCEVGGIIGNGFSIGTVTNLVNLIPPISSVSNTVATGGGDDGEPYTETGDNKYRERIRLAPSKFSVAGPEGAYKYYALSADPSIIDVSVTSPSAGVIKIIPILIDGGIPSQGILDKVMAIVSASTVRPMTDNVIVEQPLQSSYDIELHYYTTQLEETDAIQAIEGSGGAIEQYINWQRSALGRDINPDQLKKQILSPSSGAGALRVDITSPVFTELNDDTLAVFSGTLVVTHEVVSGA